MSISWPLIATVMSDGQSLEVPGTSDESSSDSSSAATGASGELGVVGELVLDEAAREPQQPGAHPVRVEEGVGHVEKPDHAVLGAEAAGRGDLAAGVEPERHRDLDAAVCLCRGRRSLKAISSSEKVEWQIFWLPLRAFCDRVCDQAGVDQHLDVRRDRRLRQAKLLGDLVDVARTLAGQQLENADPHLAREALRRSIRSSGSTTMIWSLIPGPRDCQRGFVSTEPVQ